MKILKILLSDISIIFWTKRLWSWWTFVLEDAQILPVLKIICQHPKAMEFWGIYSTRIFFLLY